MTKQRLGVEEEKREIGIGSEDSETEPEKAISPEAFLLNDPHFRSDFYKSTPEELDFLALKLENEI